MVQGGTMTYRKHHIPLIAIFPIASHWDFHDWLVVSNMFYFPFHIWDNPSHYVHIFQDGYCTTNQMTISQIFLHRFPRGCSVPPQAPQFGSKYGLMGHGLEGLYKVPSFTMWMVWHRASADVFFTEKPWNTIEIPLKFHEHGNRHLERIPKTQDLYPTWHKSYSVGFQWSSIRSPYQPTSTSQDVAARRNWPKEIHVDLRDFVPCFKMF